MKINNDSVFYSFCKTNVPAAKISAPATVEFQTLDCFGNQIRNPEDVFEGFDWDRMNPTTGPLYVEGAEPGDTLKVTIDKIVLDEKGTICCLPGEGPMGNRIEKSSTRIVPVHDGFCHYTAANGFAVKIPIKPMIGVIGVAPAEGSIGTGTPGQHGGNMDNTMVGEGATIYFPVAVEGALLGLGDLHAVMGDGEVGVCGLEIPADVTLTIEVIKGKAPKYPILENEENISIIVSRDTVDEAMEEASILMAEFIEERTNLPYPDIVMIMSLVGNIEACQIVDPKKTVRFVFPKKYIPTLAF